MGPIELIPPGYNIKFSHDYAARPSLTHQLREKLPLCKSADDVTQLILEICKLAPGSASGTLAKWRRLAEQRIQQIDAELAAARAARAAAPLIWTPPAPAPRNDEPLIVVP